MGGASRSVWVEFAEEQAELILEYLRREPVPDPDFVLRHALTLTQAAELGRPDRSRPFNPSLAAW
ncbi:MAG: hypothetical protein ACO1SV_24460 [Fimbriimonas sp.]